MNSPKSSLDDELDALIKQTLDTYVDRRGPSNEVWQKISEKLETEASAKLSRRRFTLAIPVLQAVSMALVIIASLLVLQPNTDQPSIESGSVAQVSPVIQLYDLPEMDLPSRYTPPAQPNSAIILDVIDIYALKRYQRTPVQSEEQPIYPIIMSPTDVMPHPMRLRSRIQPNTPQAIALLPRGSMQLRIK